MRYGWVAGLMLVGLSVGQAPAFAADEIEEAQARAIESLHPFGVRGLPEAFDDAARGDERPAAIELGLQWLAAHQTADGSWRPNELGWCDGKHDAEKGPKGGGKALYEVGVTGMVVAAFLGAGHTQQGKHPFAKVVRRALAWLVTKQDPEGCVGPRNTQQYVYNHAFATLALVEAYALTGAHGLRAPAQKAIDFSSFCRNPGWAWRYGVKPGDNDTSITGCMGVPLYVAGRLNRAGERAGMLEPLGLDDSVFDGMSRWLDKMTDIHWGRVGYVIMGTGPARPQELVNEFPGDKSEACTAIAVLMRQVLLARAYSRVDAKRSKGLIKLGLNLMLTLKPDWAPGKGTIDLYYWYYATMAMRQAGGKAWVAWDKALADALLENQEIDGTACDAKGSWDPEGVWAKADGGRIYSTALCLLMLETPDRMRPLPVDRTDLLVALGSKLDDPRRVASILRGLGQLRVPKAGPTVARWVEHADPLVCAAAAEALGRLDSSSDSVSALGAMLEDKRVPVRRAVLRALITQGPRLRPLVAGLTARLADEDMQVAVSAARALGASGVAEAAAALRPRMNEGGLALRVAAAAAVARLTQDKTATRPVLVAGLSAPSAAVRIEAATALEAMAPDLSEAQAALLKALGDENPHVRIQAAGALHAAGITKEACIDAWISAIDAPDARDRLRAMERLQSIGTPRATAKLTAQLFTSATALRIKAAQVLEGAGTGARPAAAVLSWCSVNGPTALRKAASNAYGALAMDAAAGRKHLLPQFKLKDQRVSEGASLGLVYLGGAIVPAVAEALGSGDDAMKAWMLEVLRRIGLPAAAAEPAMTKVLETHRDPSLKYRAARALAVIGPAAIPALPALKQALHHEKSYVGEAALKTIGQLGASSEEAVLVLREVAADRSPKRTKLRVAAIAAMGGLEKRGMVVMPDLVAAFDEKDENVRTAAVTALAGLWEHVAADLRKAFPDASTRAQNGIARVVQRVGPEAKKFVKVLIKVLETGAFSGESPFATALGRIGKPAVSRLTKLLKHEKPRVRAEAARALGLVGPDAKRALRALQRLLHDQDFNVQRHAGIAIGQIQRKP